MKLTELSNLYVAYSIWRDYRILICANEELEAKAAAKSYGDDACIEDFVVSTLDEALEGVGGDINKLRFDCDYVVVPSEDDVLNGKVEAIYATVCDKVTANTKLTICNHRGDSGNPAKITSVALRIVYDTTAKEYVYETLYITSPKDSKFVSKLYHALEEKLDIKYDEAFTFRLEGSIRFNKSIDKNRTDISIGGFEMTMAGKSVQFDFEEYRAYVDDDEPDLLHFECKNPDEDTFPDIESINRFMLEHVEEITEFYIESSEYDENGKETDNLYPIAIESLEFVLPYEDFKSIEISTDVVTKFVESEWKEAKNE